MIDLKWVNERRERRPYTPANKPKQTHAPTLGRLASAWHCPKDKLTQLILDMAKEKGLI